MRSSFSLARSCYRKDRFPRYIRKGRIKNYEGGTLHTEPNFMEELFFKSMSVLFLLVLPIIYFMSALK